MRKLPVALALIPAAALITSCSGNGGTASGGSTAAPQAGVVTAEPVQSQGTQTPQTPQTQAKVVTDGLGDPYEITYGPDGRLWVSEKSGLKVTRVDPQSGAKTTALDLTGKAFHSSPDGQDGVLGFALHPDFGKGKDSDFVYLAYTYKNGSDSATKIVRYTSKDGQLSEALSGSQLVGCVFWL
ncbi:PQQ-dependent sugar dehydrogenase [Kitasatospora brasiliensis]|uniref:PQQ-dependent sugar dehydrogenase n=1 Tax=Kitasatospora brasiliensis TaxID=3058040 RepID=UPI002930482C|nr:PQQ-dependent sugar dehydrogenase [Kitasatospora sp. K002]